MVHLSSCFLCILMLPWIPEWASMEGNVLATISCTLICCIWQVLAVVWGFWQPLHVLHKICRSSPCTWVAGWFSIQPIRNTTFIYIVNLHPNLKLTHRTHLLQIWRVCWHQLQPQNQWSSSNWNGANNSFKFTILFYCYVYLGIMATTVLFSTHCISHFKGCYSLFNTLECCLSVF